MELSKSLLSRFYKSNREKVWNQLLPDSVAILHSNDHLYTNGDGELRFIQNSNLIYLSGIELAETILVLIKSEKIKFKAIVFVKMVTEDQAVWQGHLSVEKIKCLSEIDEIRPLDQFENFLIAHMGRIENIYSSLNEHPRASNDFFDGFDRLNHPDHRFIGRMQKRYPAHNYKRLAPILSRCRMIKSLEEIEWIRKAIEITHRGLEKVISEIAPGKVEYELEAMLSCEFIRNGSRGVNGFAFTPIVASGKNSCILHYIDNDHILQKDDLVLLDVGAIFNHYNADITRCFPVGGRFSTRQKLFYNAVHRVLNEAMKLIRPGFSFTQYKEEVNKLMEEELIGLKLIRSGEAITPYFMHGVSHYLGLEVHDVGDYQTEFKSGMVITCEPGIYVKEEKIGIRLENDVLVTETGSENLSKEIPIDLEEVEDWFNRR